MGRNHPDSPRRPRDEKDDTPRRPRKENGAPKAKSKARNRARTPTPRGAGRRSRSRAGRGPDPPEAEDATRPDGDGGDSKPVRRTSRKPQPAPDPSRPQGPDSRPPAASKPVGRTTGGRQPAPDVDRAQDQASEPARPVTQRVKKTSRKAPLAPRADRAQSQIRTGRPRAEEPTSPGAADASTPGSAGRADAEGGRAATTEHTDHHAPTGAAAEPARGLPHAKLGSCPYSARHRKEESRRPRSRRRSPGAAGGRGGSWWRSLSRSGQDKRGRSRSRSRKPGAPRNSRARSGSRLRSLSRSRRNKESPPRSRSRAPVNDDDERTIVYFGWKAEEATVHVRLKAVEHGVWGRACAIHLLVEVSISRGKVPIDDATFTLSFHSSGGRGLPVLGFSPLQRLGDPREVPEVSYEREGTQAAGVRVGPEYLAVNAEGTRRENRHWTQLDQYRLESNDAVPCCLTSRLERRGEQGEQPSRFMLQAVVKCPRGKGLEVLGDVNLTDHGQWTSGRWKEVCLDKVATQESHYEAWGAEQWEERSGS